jgi:hypothetical protein
MQEATRLAKDRKGHRIWRMQPDPWKGNKGIKEEERNFLIIAYYRWRFLSENGPYVFQSTVSTENNRQEVGNGCYGILSWIRISLKYK